MHITRIFIANRTNTNMPLGIQQYFIQMKIQGRRQCPFFLLIMSMVVPVFCYLFILQSFDDLKVTQ